MKGKTKRTKWFLAFLVLLFAVEARIPTREVFGIQLKVGASLSIASFTAIPDSAGPNGGPQPGGDLLYEIRIVNNGAVFAYNVTLNLDLPPELSIKFSDHDAQRSGTHWDLGDIGDSEHKVVNVFMDVAKTAVHGTEMTTTATASADNAIPTSVEEENTTTVDGLCDTAPDSGTWFINKSCTFDDQAAVPEAVEVQAGRVLTIAPDAILEIDLQTYWLKVYETGGVLVKDGGTIRHTTGTLSGDADLEVSMTAAPNPVLASDPLDFTIAGTNHGPERADLVSVSSLLPAGVTYGMASGVGWSCGDSDGTVTCTRNTLDAGPAPEIQLYVTAPSAGGMLNMVASIAAANDTNPDNDVATAEVLVIDDTMTDLAVFKEAGGFPNVPGQPITYSITVTNNGPNPVDGATVTDSFPAPFIEILWTCEWTVGSSCTPSGTGDILDTVSLLPEGTLFYKATAIVAEGTAGPIDNSATVSVPPEMRDFAPGNNISTVRTGEVIFADGFESGDTSRWSSAVVTVK